MSKKWITLLVAAVIGALLLPTAAFAGCSAALVGQVKATDASGTIGDPVPLPGQDNFSQVSPQAVTEPILNNEGVKERIMDILVWDDGNAGNCFQLGNQFQFTVNAQIVSPAPGAGVPAAGANLDVYDSAAATGLLVTANSFTAVGSGNVVQTIIQVLVNRAGSAATPLGGLLKGAGSTGAAFRIKNIRIDDTSFAAGAHVTWALVQGPASAAATPITFDLAPPSPDIITPGNGVALGFAGVATATLKAPVNNANLTTKGIGVQNSGTGLTTAAVFPNLQEFANGVFRLNKKGVDGTTGTGAACTSSSAAADTCVSGVANDIATVPTSLVFAVSAIPSGVTVTFPSTMTTAAAAGAGGSLTWTSTSRGGSPLAFTATAASGSQAVVYDTTHNDSTAAATGITIESADNADPGTPTGDTVSGTTNPNCKIKSGALVSNNVAAATNAVCDANPKIGVIVGAASQAGTSKVYTAFGRGASSLFTGDDVAAAGDVPAYTGDARKLVKNASFFTINPTRTTMLFPFVAAGGFNTGIEVASTGSDVGVFGNTTATASASGGITFYFVGTTNSGTVVNAVLNTDLTNGGTPVPASSCPFANLDTNGRLVAGKSFACGASALLALTGTSTTPAPTSFSGYVIAVLGANYGHGFSVQFDGSGAPYAAANALVLENGTGNRNGINATDGGLGN